jgi:hypothetical protein
MPQSIIQWTRIFGTGMAELVCHPVSLPFHAHSVWICLLLFLILPAGI